MKRLSDLFKVKSLVTLAMVGGFLYLTVTGSIDKENFMMVFAMVITYYFNKDQKDAPEEDETGKGEDEKDG